MLMSDYEKIRAMALRSLARREYSRAELFARLTFAGYAEEDVRLVLDEFREKNWQNDARFAESFVRSHIARGQGPLKIRYALCEKGVEEMPPFFDQFDWYSLAEDVYRKKYGDEKVRLTAAEKSKRIRFLAQRGFDTATACDVVKCLS